MKRIAAVLCVAALLPGLLSGCGGSSSKESRVELTKNGKIIEYTVEDFSSPNYDADELEDFIDDEIEAFKEENEGRIKVRREKVRRDTAYLTLRYNKASTYAAFNGVECFAGTIEEARAAGYDFSRSFILAVDEEEDAEEDETALTSQTSARQTKVPGSQIVSDDSLNVLILDTDVNVSVPGEVQYYYITFGSASLLEKDTVAIQLDEEGISGVDNLVYVIYKK